MKQLLTLSGGSTAFIAMLVSLVAILCFPGPAASTEIGAYELPAVTVTADKRETLAEKTPIALTVFTEKDIADAGITTVRDVLMRIPNLSYNPGQGGLNFMTFRGAGASAATSTSPIVLYVDGVPVDTFLNPDANLMDVERVEMLRGPQSAIYGKNVLGGVINVITKKPDNTFRSKLTAGVGTLESSRAGASVSGPVVEDRLFFSFSALHDYYGGYMNSENASGKNWKRYERFKGLVRAMPSDALEINLHTDYTAFRSGFSPYRKGEGVTLKSIATDRDYEDQDILNMSLHAKASFDALAAESITTFRRESMDFRMDMTPISPDVYGHGGREYTRREVTQELRFRSPDEYKGVVWLAGLFAGYSDMDNNKAFSDYAPFTFWGMTYHPSEDRPFREYTTDFAPFGQIEIPVTDALKVTAGLRWQYTNRKASIRFRPNGDTQLAYGAVPMSTHLEDEWNEFLPKLNISYQLTDDHMVYAGVNRSFLPGGFNTVTTTGKDAVFDSQTAWNYEIGAKTNWFDRRLSVNLAFFYSRFDDLQVMQHDFATNSTVSDNAGRATSYGAEIDVAAKISKGLDLELGFGYTRAKYNDYEAQTVDAATYQPVTHDYGGNYVALTPCYSGTAALIYRHESGFFARGEALYWGKMHWEADNEAKRGDVITVNARLGWEMESFDVYLYGTNIFGERYLDYYSRAGDMALVAAPQEFGVQAVYRF